ncbi:MAG TPA: phosphoribosylamine--glycine ligase [Candidatus Paceibacterota bacterium]|nr:phosphoribosylamine--glycine ligase [Candidatus Paceibacterota bacterium]
MSNLKVLIIGGGGREHALSWKLKQSPKVEKIFMAPGNAGTAQIAENLGISKKEEIIEWLKSNPMDLVVVGPDDYLAIGMTDAVRELNIPVFGPTKAAAEIEWSKSFAKELMRTAGIPTARFENFTDPVAALSYIEKGSFPVVIKASGLAAGKGVIIANDFSEAEAAVKEIMESKIFGESGNTIVIEEYLLGREISTHAFSDGEHISMFPSAQDHKRIFENDEGPNTGGMGTVAPLPWVTGDHMKVIEEQIVRPLIKALKAQGTPFRGLLFPGVMITEEGPKVIEFNARFGDPETQSYMRLLETDLVDILFACINGTLDTQEIKWSNKSAATVMLASSGYPGNYEKGKEILGLEKNTDTDIVVFHGGTKLQDGKLVTNGGRVLGISAVGDNLQDALNKSYKAIENISFEGMQYRRDIGKKSL